MSKERIKELANHYGNYTKETRGYLRENPELSSQEFETSKFLKSEIEKLGLEIVEAEGTGFIAILDTGKPGKTVGIRADIDALPMDESEDNLVGKKKYVSKVKGAAHTCGHDGHMSIALSVAKIFVDMKEDLVGKVIFIFEEGEEIGAGIASMLKLLENYEFDVIYGNHLAAFVDSGKFALEAGPRMAGNSRLEMYVVGRGGHGSRPDLSINPIFGMVEVLSGLATAWANQIDVTKTVTLGITQVVGGTAWNIFPEKVMISGSLRFFDTEEGHKAMDVIKKVADNTAKAHNCSIEYTENFLVMNDPVMNDEEYSKIARDTIVELYGEEALADGVVWFASESFSQYIKIAPTILNLVGVRNEEFGSGAEHHNIHFDIDEEALVPAVEGTASIIYDFLYS